MWFIGDIIIFLCLLKISIEDWKTRYISLHQLLPLGMGALIMVFILTYGSVEIGIHLIGMLFSGIFLLVSKCSKERLGYGDSIVLLILGFYMGVWEIMEVAIWAFGLCFVCIFIGIIFRKIQRESEVAFTPFILIAYTGVRLFVI